MASQTLPLTLFFFFFAAHSLCNAAAPLTHYCSTNRKTSPSISSKISDILSTLSKTPSGFSSVSNGGAYGLAQCRRDVGAADCQACLKDAARRLPKLCGDESDARIWFDYCFLRYNTKSFAGKLDTGYGLFYVNVENVTEDLKEQRRFDRELGSMMGKIQEQAAEKGRLGLSKMERKFTPFVTIYALAQCTQDLPPLACAQCISISVGSFPALCPHRKGCRALYSSCYVRYEIYPFFFPVADQSSVEGSYVIVSSPPG